MENVKNHPLNLVSIYDINKHHPFCNYFGLPFETCKCRKAVEEDFELKTMTVYGTPKEDIKEETKEGC